MNIFIVTICQCYAEQNDSRSEEINVIDESQTENRPVLVQDGIRLEKAGFLARPLCLLCLAAAQEITHAAHLLFRLGELHDSGSVSTLLTG